MKLHSISVILLISAAMLFRPTAEAQAPDAPESLDRSNVTESAGASADSVVNDAETRTIVEKVLFIGDSMTGWLAERLNSYGNQNGFEVATYVWDGSTINKWGNAAKLKTIIEKENPDAVFICLGLNELFERNPESRFGKAVSKIKAAVGDRGLVWVGPPSWPGHTEGTTLNNWLSSTIGEENYFDSFGLTIERQSRSNPHPSKSGITQWVDSIVEWLPQSNVRFKSLDTPIGPLMTRGKTFVYKRMGETL